MLAEFTEARLAEREAAAKAATAGPWQWVEEEDVAFGDHGPNLMSSTATWADPVWGGPHAQTVLSSWGHDDWGVSVEDADKAHIALSDPARVLREVGAMRKILAMHTEAQGWSYPPGDGDEAVQEALTNVARALAAIWSDHPDYAEAVRP